MKRCIWPIVMFVLFCRMEMGHCGATIEQMEKSLAMIRGVCLPKTKITDAMADGIRTNNIPDEKPLKCYIHCCLEMTGMMKKNKINYEATIKQIDMMMPDNMKEPYKAALGVCKDAANGIKDNCEAGYVLLKCIKNEYPDMIFA